MEIVSKLENVLLPIPRLGILIYMYNEYPEKYDKRYSYVVSIHTMRFKALQSRELCIKRKYDIISLTSVR